MNWLPQLIDMVMKYGLDIPGHMDSHHRGA